LASAGYVGDGARGDIPGPGPGPRPSIPGPGPGPGPGRRGDHAEGRADTEAQREADVVAGAVVAPGHVVVLGPPGVGGAPAAELGEDDPDGAVETVANPLC
jgi:hypothetical protein